MEIVYGFYAYDPCVCFGREFIVAEICSVSVMKKDEKPKAIISVPSLSGACFWWKIHLYLKFPPSAHKASAYYMLESWKWEQLRMGRRLIEKAVPSFGCSLINQWCNGRLWLKSLSFQAPINTADSANSNILACTIAGPLSSIKCIYGL